MSIGIWQIIVLAIVIGVLLGSGYLGIYIFKQNPQFKRYLNTSIAGANIIGGERPELIIGQHAGGLYMMQKENDQALGIAAVSPIESSLKIHPNPTTGLAIVSGAINEKNAWITVTSLNGSEVMQRRVQSESAGMINETIDLDHFPSGVYIVSLKTSSSLEWVRLLKQ